MIAARLDCKLAFDGMRWLPPPTALWRAELSLVVCCAELHGAVP